jgi:hypothetical protein
MAPQVALAVVVEPSACLTVSPGTSLNICAALSPTTYGIASRRLLGRQTVGIMCLREDRQSLPLGPVLLTDGVRRARKQAEHHGNQQKIAASVHTPALLLGIGICGRTSSPYPRSPWRVGSTA